VFPVRVRAVDHLLHHLAVQLGREEFRLDDRLEQAEFPHLVVHLESHEPGERFVDEFGVKAPRTLGLAKPARLSRIATGTIAEATSASAMSTYIAISSL
jgi:hypothetical protein